MTATEKETLRDLFEGCFDYFTACVMAGVDNDRAAADAAATWRRWQSEMDETGSYKF